MQPGIAWRHLVAPYLAVTGSRRLGGIMVNAVLTIVAHN